MCKAVDKTEMDLAVMINKSIYSLNKNNSLFPLEETSLSDLLCKGLFFDLASYWVTKACCKGLFNVIVSLQSF